MKAPISNPAFSGLSDFTIPNVVRVMIGANEGVLTLLWDILCPVCRIPSQVIDTLKSLREHGNCEACQLDFDLDFANSVELIFRVHPEVRETDVATYCIGGPAHSPHDPQNRRSASRRRARHVHRIRRSCERP